MHNRVHSKEKMGLFTMLWKLLKMRVQDGGLFFLTVVIVGIFHAVSIGVKTVSMQKFFDQVEFGMKGDATLKTVMIWAMIVGGAAIMNQALNGLHNYMSENLGLKIRGKIHRRIADKMGRIDILNFESTHTLDFLKKVDEGVQASVFFTFIAVTIVTFYIPYFIMMGAYMYTLRPILAFSIVLIFTPVMLSQVVKLKAFTKLTDESAPIKREFEYYERCLTNKEYFKETRLLGSGKYFMRIYSDALTLMNKKIWKTKKRSELIELYMRFITLIGFAGVVFMLVDSLLKGYISVGAFGAVFASLRSMFRTMEEVICRHIGRLTENMGSVRSLMEFFEMEERDGSLKVDQTRPDIKVVDGSFMYPGAEKYSLKNINIHIKSGETVAIVGENGSGKTTLVKFLTGMYRPTEGTVFFNGVDTKEVDPNSLHKNVSAVFQKFQRYKISLGDNISLSDAGDKIEGDVDKLDDSIEKADFHMDDEKFKDGYDTVMSREFKGIDISGGQWQRVAIARGFYREHNTIILDEPTAAIDPIEETKLYNKFAHMAKDNTAILVTHRLGSAKIADRIIVMDEGEIIQVGTHDDLLNIEGKYADMYRAQSKWYDDVAIEALA